MHLQNECILQVYQKEFDSQMNYTTQLNDKLNRQLGDIQTQMDSMKENSEVWHYYAFSL